MVRAARQVRLRERAQSLGAVPAPRERPLGEHVALDDAARSLPQLEFVVGEALEPGAEGQRGARDLAPGALERGDHAPPVLGGAPDGLRRGQSRLPLERHGGERRGAVDQLDVQAPPAPNREGDLERQVDDAIVVERLAELDVVRLRRDTLEHPAPVTLADVERVGDVGGAVAAVERQPLGEARARPVEELAQELAAEHDRHEVRRKREVQALEHAALKAVAVRIGVVPPPEAIEDAVPAVPEHDEVAGPRAVLEDGGVDVEAELHAVGEPDHLLEAGGDAARGELEGVMRGADDVRQARAEREVDRAADAVREAGRARGEVAAHRGEDRARVEPRAERQPRASRPAEGSPRRATEAALELAASGRRSASASLRRS